MLDFFPMPISAMTPVWPQILFSLLLWPVWPLCDLKSYLAYCYGQWASKFSFPVFLYFFG